MDATAELGRDLASTRFSLSMEMGRLTRGRTAEPVLRDQIVRREREQRNVHFPCSVDHEQDWRPCLVDPYSCYMCDHTYIYTYQYNRFFVHFWGFHALYELKAIPTKFVGQ